VQVFVEVKQGERVQAAAALAAMKKVKLAQTFAVWRQYCRGTQVGCHIFCDHFTLHSTALGKLDTSKGLAAGSAAHSHLV